MIDACTKADCAALASLHGPLSGFVATNWYGVARPWAVSGCAGTINVQSPFTAACAACDLKCGSTKTPAPMRAIASDTTTPTRINGENLLRCVGRVLNGLRRSLRIISYLFLFLNIHACYAVQVPKSPNFRHSNAQLTTIVEAFILPVVESCASHP
jgi:hypothetical protein